MSQNESKKLKVIKFAELIIKELDLYSVLTNNRHNDLYSKKCNAMLDIYHITINPVLSNYITTNWLDVSKNSKDMMHLFMIIKQQLIASNKVMQDFEAEKLVDQNKRYLMFKNATIELSDYKIKKVQTEYEPLVIYKKFEFTSAVPIGANEENIAKFAKWLRERFRTDIDFEIFKIGVGASMFAKPKQKTFYVLFGDSNAGKSFLIENVLTWILGRTNCKQLSLKDFNESAKTTWADVSEKTMACIIADTGDNPKLSAEKAKMFVDSNSSYITKKVLFEDERTFAHNMTLWIATNAPLKFTDAGNAMSERIRYIEMNTLDKKDWIDIEEIKDNEELERDWEAFLQIFINSCVGAFINSLKNKNVPKSEINLNLLDTIKADMNFVELFLQESQETKLNYEYLTTKPTKQLYNEVILFLQEFGKIADIKNTGEYFDADCATPIKHSFTYTEKMFDNAVKMIGLNKERQMKNGVRSYYFTERKKR